ncbi:alpha/beta hydrolase [Mycobacterium sp. CVI_P3]|uniref:Alpha/beta hydrolase n=1 Tax=Mycobacterium pinniadriaticum TaxID=2994102 RepID=A0ABT3S7F1_9MYCO|nr:alpha/beta hydrolase [Mycobacterium pinniadriaticum]MCX2929039.1 alpha/beta hydrolase [Mycobacterium pinniadriaticum]MCX2935094.1 alpha/beta hydrolase [Mycobacterium pinniadriaticum]
MALPMDPEVQTLLAPIMEAAAELDPPAIGDIATRRERIVPLFQLLADLRGHVPGVEVTRHTLTTGDGAELDLAWYYPSHGRLPGSAALYLHGGGMIHGLTETGPGYDAAVRSYVAASGVPMLMVDYRVAPEHPNPTPVEDCYAALCWLAENAATLGADATRLAVAGDSAGGGLAAGVSLLARDRGGPALAAQLLIYPMLDDRTVAPDPQLAPESLTWTYDDNITGWGALLGDRAGSDDVSRYAAPARAPDLAGLPPTYIDVGDLDIFRDEDIAYAVRLSAAGVPTELHVHPGCPHAFEALAPTAAVSARVTADRIRRLSAI